MGKKRSRVWPSIPQPLAAPVMDNHTHLPVHEGEIPKADGIRLPLDEQLARAFEVGVTHLISSACELPDFDPTIALAHQYPQVRVALAIHPNEAALHAGHTDPSPDGLAPKKHDHHIPLDEALAEVDSRLCDPLVVAVGETGLDYYRTAEPGRIAQAESFSAHLEMARQHGLPLQIHDRDAHADTLNLLKRDAHNNQPIVFHCFSGDADMARELAENGWYASFAGPLTYPANSDLQQALSVMPRDRVLVETDAPYLTPVPERGNPNASYVMAHTVRFIAQLWDVSEEKACQHVMENAQKLYGTW